MYESNMDIIKQDVSLTGLDFVVWSFTTHLDVWLTC